MKYFYLTKAFRQVQILKVQNLQNGFSVSFFPTMKFFLSELSEHAQKPRRTDFTYLKLSNCETCRRAPEILSTQPPIRLDPTVVCIYRINSIYSTYTVSRFRPATSFTSFCFFFFRTCKNFEIGTYWKHLCSTNMLFEILSSFAGGGRRLLLRGANVIWLHWHQFVTIWCWWFENMWHT